MSTTTQTIGQHVEGGRPYTEDYDQGVILAVHDDGRVTVAWQSGVRTTESARTLRTGWSGRFAARDEEEES